MEFLIFPPTLRAFLLVSGQRHGFMAKNQYLKTNSLASWQQTCPDWGFLVNLCVCVGVCARVCVCELEEFGGYITALDHSKTGCCVRDLGHNYCCCQFVSWEIVLLSFACPYLKCLYWTVNKSHLFRPKNIYLLSTGSRHRALQQLSLLLQPQEEVTGQFYRATVERRSV